MTRQEGAVASDKNVEAVQLNSRHVAGGAPVLKEGYGESVIGALQVGYMCVKAKAVARSIQCVAANVALLTRRKLGRYERITCGP